MTWYITLVEVEEGEEFERELERYESNKDDSWDREWIKDELDHMKDNIMESLWTVDMEEAMTEIVQQFTYDGSSKVTVHAVSEVDRSGKRPIFRVETYGGFREVEGKVRVKKGA